MNDLNDNEGQGHAYINSILLVSKHSYYNETDVKYSKVTHALLLNM